MSRWSASGGPGGGADSGDDRIEVRADVARRAFRVGRRCLWAVVLITAAISVGWLLGIERLATPLGQGHPLRLVPALALLVLAVALLDARSRTRRLPPVTLPVVSGLGVAAGLLALVLFATGGEVRADALLGQIDWSPFAARRQPPAPQAAVAFGCLALATGLPARWDRTRDGAILVALVLAGFGLVGHAFDVAMLMTAGGAYPLPLEPSIALLLLGVGVALTNPSRSSALSLVLARSPGGWTLRRLLPLAIAMPLLAGVLEVQLHDGRAVSDQTAIWIGVVVALLAALLASWLVAAWTDRLAARARAEQARYRNLFDSVPEGLYETGPDGRLRVANDPLANLLGFDDAAEMLASVDHVQTLWMDPSQRVALLDRIAAGEVTGSLRVQLRRRDGQGVQAEISYRAVDDGSGRGPGLRGTIRDITAEVAAQDRLAELQEQYRLAFENGPLGRLVLDVAASPPRFLQVNQALANLLGYTPEEMCALDPRSFLHPDDVRDEDEAMFRCAQGEDANVSYSARRRHKNGEWMPVWLTGTLLRDERGEPRYAMATIEDRRPRLEAEAETQRAWNETLRRIATAVEYRDEETGAHVERMSAYCELLARHLGFGGERAATLRVAAQLHDAGKIAIPDHILLKPGRLTQEERRVIESHTEVGYRLLRGTGSPVLDLAAMVAWTHHERFDGSGYPRGLAGDRIPIEGRIATVADVFDALTSDRVYRQAMSVDDAVAIIRAGRGKQFDPEVLDVFLEHLDEVLALAEQYRDPAGEIVPFQPPHTRYTLRAVEGSA